MEYEYGPSTEARGNSPQASPVEPIGTTQTLTREEERSRQRRGPAAEDTTTDFLGTRAMQGMGWLPHWTKGPTAFYTNKRSLSPTMWSVSPPPPPPRSLCWGPFAPPSPIGLARLHLIPPLPAEHLLPEEPLLVYQRLDPGIKGRRAEVRADMEEYITNLNLKLFGNPEVGRIIPAIQQARSSQQASEPAGIRYCSREPGKEYVHVQQLQQQDSGTGTEQISQQPLPPSPQPQYHRQSQPPPMPRQPPPTLVAPPTPEARPTPSALEASIEKDSVRIIHTEEGSVVYEVKVTPPLVQEDPTSPSSPAGLQPPSPPGARVLTGKIGTPTARRRRRTPDAA